MSADKPKDLLSIGVIARRTGMQVSAIRYYADELLIPSVRSVSGHRLFSRSVIRRVSFILIAQSLGYTLTQIRAALESLPDNRTPTKADWEKLSRRFSKDIETQIERLQLLKNKLSSCIGCGCLSLRSCQLYNPNDFIADNGSGPRFLLGDQTTGFNSGRN